MALSTTLIQKLQSQMAENSVFSEEEIQAVIGTLNSQVKPYTCKKCGKQFTSLTTDKEECLECSQKDDVHIAKKDGGKAPIHMVNPNVLFWISQVRDWARRNKYPDEWGWKEIGNDEFGNPPIIRYYDAMERHLIEWFNGKKVDAESKLPIVWHILTNAYFITELEMDERAAKDNL